MSNHTEQINQTSKAYTSLELVKAAWKMTKLDKSIVVYPLLTSLGCLAVVVAISLVNAAMGGSVWWMFSFTQDLRYFALLAVEYLLTYLVVNYSNTALAVYAIDRLEGRTPSVSRSFRHATRRIGAITLYTFIGSTVGMIFRVAERYLPIGPSLLAWLGEMGWAVATVFAVPILAAKEESPVQAIKESASIIKAKWGVAALGDIFNITFLQFALLAPLIIIIPIIVIAPLSITGQTYSSLLQYPVWALGLLLLSGLYAVAVIAITTVARRLFYTALYLHATTGKQPAQYNEDLYAHAFKPKKDLFV